MQTISSGSKKLAGDSMSEQDSGKSKNKQLAKTTNSGLKTVSTASVSATSKAKHAAAYSSRSSSAPLVRVTGGYAGID